MEIFLASFATEDYNAMASALSEMGATGNDIDVDSFANDLQKIFSSLQVMSTEGHKYTFYHQQKDTWFDIQKAWSALLIVDGVL